MVIKENKEMVSVHFESILDLMDFQPETSTNKYEFDWYMSGGSNRHHDKKWLGRHVSTHKEIINMALLEDKVT